MTATDKLVRNLQESLKAKRIGAVCTLLKQIVTARIDSVPVPTLKHIIENVDNATACNLSLIALIGMALKKEKQWKPSSGICILKPLTKSGGQQ